MRKFILDTDWWTDCDDAVAVRLLCNAHKNHEVELLGININACMPHSAASLDIFLQDCGVEVPIGLAHDAVGFAGNPAYQEPLAKTGQARRTNADVPASADFYRSLLKNAEDGSVEILSIGFTQELARMLQTPETAALVSRKVTHLWIMAGKWDEDGGREYNFYKNAITSRAAAELCANWPTPITFLGFEVGHTVITGTRLSPDDLLKKVMVWHGSANGRSSWDPMLALLAVTGDPEKAGYRCVYGKAEVNSTDGSNHFLADANGPHRYVIKLHPDSFYADAVDARLN